MIRVLHYIPAFGYGGIETVVLNLYKNIDKKFQFNFLVETKIPEYAERIIKNNNGKIIQIPKMTNKSKLLLYFKSLYRVFKYGKYDVFHCHSLDTRPFPMIFAKIFKIKLRIMHIHFNDFNDKKHLCLKKFFINIGQRNANYYIACSARAAKNILSAKNSKKAMILNNGIDINRFRYDKNNGNNTRNKLNINSNVFLIGCIGRLSYLKNQKFVINIANKFPKRYQILFLGDGEDKAELESVAAKLKLENVDFMGNVENVKDYLDAFDLVLMPSISEAMPLTLIEIQANGVPAIVSESIDEEFIINSNICRLALNNDIWLRYIHDNDLKRISPNKMLKKFDIKNITKLYENTIICETENSLED